PLDRNRLAGLLAVAVGTVLDALQRGVDLGDQLALAVGRPGLDRAGGLRRGAGGGSGVGLVLVLEMLGGLLGFLQDVFTPGDQLVAEVLPLALVHERLFFARPVGSFFFQTHAPRSVHFPSTHVLWANTDRVRRNMR